MALVAEPAKPTHRLAALGRAVGERMAPGENARGVRQAVTTYAATADEIDRGIAAGLVLHANLTAHPVDDRRPASLDERTQAMIAEIVGCRLLGAVWTPPAAGRRWDGGYDAEVPAGRVNIKHLQGPRSIRVVVQNNVTPAAFYMAMRGPIDALECPGWVSHAEIVETGHWFPFDDGRKLCFFASRLHPLPIVATVGLVHPPGTAAVLAAFPGSRVIHSTPMENPAPSNGTHPRLPATASQAALDALRVAWAALSPYDNAPGVAAALAAVRDAAGRIKGPE